MPSTTISLLKKFHYLITGEKRLSLLDNELVRKYPIEHMLLSSLSKPKINTNAPLYCSGCHRESGIAIDIDSDKCRLTFLYTSPTGEIRNGHSLTIIRYTPKTSFICKEIYHRKIGEIDLEAGWCIDPSEIEADIDQMLTCASQHAS